MERGRTREDGTPALPRAVSVFCSGGGVELPALSTKCRLVPWCAFQHGIVCFAHYDGGASLRFEARHVHSYLWGSASLQQPCGTGAPATDSRTASTAGDAVKSEGEEYPRFSIRRFSARWLRSASGHQSADCGLRIV